jgi:hypothetical protein
MLSVAGIPLPTEKHPIWDTRRLWSLWDMINFNLGVFWNGLDLLNQLINSAHSRGEEEVEPEANDYINKHVQMIISSCVKNLHLVTAGRGSCARLEVMFFQYRNKKYTYKELLYELHRLFTEIKSDAIREQFFHYQTEMVTMINSIDQDWSKTVSSFHSLRPEIAAAIDCYSFGDYSGCIFHMVRVSEAGLRAIARECGIKNIGKKPLEWAMWSNVFDKIDDQLKTLRGKSPGPKKDIALDFYNTTLSDLRKLQGYRDPTMHFRDNYGQGEAHDAIVRVKSLMETISTKLREDRIRKINWGL